MKLQMQSIHFDADKNLLDFIQRKMDKLETFYDRILGGEVYLKIENDSNGANKLVHIKVNIPGNDLMAKEHGATFEEAVDLAYESLKRQLSRLKEKNSAH